MSTFEELVAVLETASTTRINAYLTEVELEDGRHAAKYEAIRRLMETENPHTKKAHSASSAADIVSLDAGYAQYLRECRVAVAARMAADDAYQIAKFRVQMALTMKGV